MAWSAANVRPGTRRFVLGFAVILPLVLLGVGAYFIRQGKGQEDGSATPPFGKLNSGHSIPLLGLGTSGATDKNATDAIRSALAIGYRHIDTAQMYGNEAQIGEALAEALKAGTVKREELFITTKLNSESHARESVEPALRESLRKLQLDYVDLFLVHWPVTDQHGPTLQPPMEATWAGMEGVADKGLARSIGISNFSPEKIERWFKDARIPPAVNQVELHAHWRNERVLNWCKDNGIHVTAYAPMSSPGTMASRGTDVPNLQKDATVVKVAEANGRTPQQVLLQWGLQHGDTQHVSVIPKSANPEHQRGNFGALQGTLSAADYEVLETLPYQNRYFSGDGLAITKDGPWFTYESFWDEPPPKDYHGQR